MTSTATGSKGMIKGKITTKAGKEDDTVVQKESTIEERCFVCVGTYAKDEIAIWCMTYSPDYKSVTMWDCLKHEQYTLEKRVNEKLFEGTNIDCLKAYIKPTAILEPQD